MLIDSHCHLHDREFLSAEQAEECLKRARKAGVEKIICIGTSHEDSMAAQEFASTHENVYWTYGVHPESANDRQLGHDSSGDGSLAPVDQGRPPVVVSKRVASYSFARLLRRPVTGLAPFILGRDLRTPPQSVSKLPVAIGEVGLDYHYAGYDREAQIKLFEQMLQLAVDNDLPVSFHVREAFADFFPVVENFPQVHGVVHSFTDSKKVLKRILNETDYYVGVNGLATYSTLPLPPLERILLETDAPFLAPAPHRGEQNEPAFVSEIAKWLAAKLETEQIEVAKVTTKNVNTLFGLTS
ncbi:MAG: TatD family hydrolase [Candidatus Saccharibacteria bacterium]|nr:TatD family hydrolase [Candidatus Saccharibacteria bacterium]